MVINIGNNVEQNLTSTETLKKEVAQLSEKIPLIAEMAKQFSYEQTTMSDKILEHVTSSCKETADATEEHIVTLPDIIIPQIKELKSIEDNLLSFFKKFLEPINQYAGIKAIAGSNSDGRLELTPVSGRHYFNTEETKKAVKCISQLTKLMKTVEGTQKNIQEQGTIQIDQQGMLDSLLRKTIPILVSIQKLLKSDLEWGNRENHDELHRCCKQLYKKMQGFDAVESQLKETASYDGMAKLKLLLQKNMLFLDTIDKVILPKETIPGDDTIQNRRNTIDEQTDEINSLQGDFDVSKLISNVKSKRKHSTVQQDLVIHSKGIQSSSLKNAKNLESSTSQTCLKSNAKRIHLTKSPVTTKKRSLSSSTEDSIDDTNSDAQEQIESTIDSPSTEKPLQQEMYGSDIKGPKQKRARYKDTSRVQSISAVANKSSEMAGYNQSPGWQHANYLEKDLDSSSAASDDLFG